MQKSPKIVAEKGAKKIGQVTSHERDVLVTMCCCAYAVGQAFPPYIFPLVHFKSHMLHDAPNGSLGLACKSGWMTKELFVESFNHFLKFMNASISNPALLVMGNHESHLLVALVSVAFDHGLTIVTFPPNCSH